MADLQAWKIAPIDTLRKAVLLTLAKAAEPDHPRWRDWTGTKADLVAIIRRRRQEEYSLLPGMPRSQQDRRISGPRVVRVGDRGYVVPDTCIRADSINAFLRSLPRLDPEDWLGRDQ